MNEYYWWLMFYLNTINFNYNHSTWLDILLYGLKGLTVALFISPIAMVIIHKLLSLVGLGWITANDNVIVSIYGREEVNDG